MSTSLTREALLEKGKHRYAEVEVKDWGTVGIRSLSEFRRSARAAEMFSDEGEPDRDKAMRHRVWSIVDQLMVDENTPMFTNEDVPALLDADTYLVSTLYDAIVEFNGGELYQEKKDESSHSSDS